MHYAYPATLEQDDDGFMLSFDGLPGVTRADTWAEALDYGRDLLETSLEMLLDDGEQPPQPPPSNGRPIIIAEI